MRKEPQAPSLLRRIGTSVLLGLAVAMAGVLVEYLLGRVSPLSLAGLDSIAVGIIAGLVVFAYEQRQYRAVLEKISMIAAMNHHVRNALQAITYAPYAEQKQQIALIQESVNRIQWALREILPGNTDETNLQGWTKD
jgi:hypothetical protein